MYVGCVPGKSLEYIQKWSGYGVFNARLSMADKCVSRRKLLPMHLNLLQCNQLNDISFHIHTSNAIMDRCTETIRIIITSAMIRTMRKFICNDIIIHMPDSTFRRTPAANLKTRSFQHK